MIIFSITNNRNLDCTGCYATVLHQSKDKELSQEQFKDIIQQARDVGISVILLAGVEPFMREGLLDTLKEFPS